MEPLTAGQVEEGAVNGGNPEVGGAGVKQHGEGLRGGPDADGAVVLSLGGKGQRRVTGLSQDGFRMFHTF